MRCDVFNVRNVRFIRIVSNVQYVHVSSIEAFLMRLRRHREDPDGAASVGIVRKMRGRVEAMELFAKAEEAIASREGGRGFRRIIRDESGATREYFSKRLTTSDGDIGTRLS